MTTSSLPPRAEAMPNLTSISRSLTEFASSNRSFQIIHTFPASLARQPTTTLCILDSSFNPPTQAHMGMCLSALKNDRKKAQENKRGGNRLLLLLATKNADKAALPVEFNHRLTMMGCLAEDLRRAVKAGPRAERAGGEKTSQGENGGDPEKKDAVDAGQESDIEDMELVVDVGVTKEAIFTSKARAIDESGAYVLPNSRENRTFLVGYDTLTRLLDVRYYPNKSLGPLKNLFEPYRIRVTMREPPPRAEQEKFVKCLEGSHWEAKDWEREWAGRIELVDGSNELVS